MRKIKNTAIIVLITALILSLTACGSGGSSESTSTVNNNRKTISAGYNSGFVILNDGSLWGWGGNMRGQLGTGDDEDRLEPVHILDGVKSVVSGGGVNWVPYAAHTMAIKEDNSLWGWGGNIYNHVANVEDYKLVSPVHIMDDVISVAVGQFHTLAVTSDGVMWG